MKKLGCAKCDGEGCGKVIPPSQAFEMRGKKRALDSCADCVDKMIRGREMKRMRFCGAIAKRPFGNFGDELFLGNSGVPLLAQLQYYLALAGGKPAGSVRIGDQFFDGPFEIEIRNDKVRGTLAKFECVRRFKVGDVDVVDLLQPGVQVELEARPTYGS